MVRVLVVDDSAFMRYLIARELSADPVVEVVGTARDGVDALEKIASLRPDVVTMDVEMPRMDGLGALERIMAESPLPVILLSSWTQEGASVTIRGLELGAVDFTPKPPPVQAPSSQATWQQLLAQVKSAGTLEVRRLGFRPSAAPAVPVAVGNARRRAGRAEKVVVVGSSTGGPRALVEVVPRLPADLPAAVLLVQHMPPGFTGSLARRLDEVSALAVREAEDGDSMESGVALLAPGGFHLVVRRGGTVSLEKSPPLHGVRPAADVAMESAASLYGASTVGVVLTGMGSDGTRGSLAIRRAGGFVLAEDESTCVVYGMPRSAREAGGVDLMVRLEAVADAIVEAVAAPGPRSSPDGRCPNSRAQESQAPRGDDLSRRPPPRGTTKAATTRFIAAGADVRVGPPSAAASGIGAGAPAAPGRPGTAGTMDHRTGASARVIGGATR